jgi:hypothetical protein
MHKLVCDPATDYGLRAVHDGDNLDHAFTSYFLVIHVVSVQ